jgi:hypothetical protein
MATERDRHELRETPDDDERDELDELIAEIAQEHPEFPAMVEAALRERMAARARGEDRNDIPWYDEALEEQNTSMPSSAAPR